MSSVTTGGNRSTRRKPAMLRRVVLDNTLLTCDQRNFNRTTVRSQNRTLVQWRNEVNFRPGREWKMPPPNKNVKKEQQKTQKAGMHKEHSIEKWNILSPLCILIQITNQRSCVNLCKLRCSTVINLEINSNQLVLHSSINNSRMT